MKLKFRDPHLHYIAVTAIIHNKGNYLITKRAPTEKAFPNMWTVPGGRISALDYLKLPKTTPAGWYNTVVETLKREVLEEINLRIKNIKYLIDMTILRPDGIPVVILSYYADFAGGKVKIDSESTDFAWVSVNKAKKYDLIEGIYEEIVMADKIIKGANPAKVKFKPRKY